jgi:hypothetical protein
VRIPEIEKEKGRRLMVAHPLGRRRTAMLACVPNVGVERFDENANGRCEHGKGGARGAVPLTDLVRLSSEMHEKIFRKSLKWIKVSELGADA